MKKIRLLKKQIDTEKRDYILYNNNNFEAAEAIKAARTNLMFTAGDEKCPVISFTSAHMFEGKSTVCANMALAFAQAGFKTLIIDADMRKPTMHKYFKTKSSPGLSDVLGGLIQKVEIYTTEFNNLHIIPSGTIPPNPSELITSERVGKLLQQLRENFDYIFIDSPPVLIVTDSLVLSKKVTGTVLVVRQNISRTNFIKETVEAFNNIDIKPLGFIFNDYDMVTRQGYHYKSQKHGNPYEYCEMKKPTPKKND